MANGNDLHAMRVWTCESKCLDACVCVWWHNSDTIIEHLCNIITARYNYDAWLHTVARTCTHAYINSNKCCWRRHSTVTISSKAMNVYSHEVNRSIDIAIDIAIGNISRCQRSCHHPLPRSSFPLHYMLGISLTLHPTDWPIPSFILS